MSPEQLLALACARGVNLDAVTRGSKPDWTAEDVALGLGGLGKRETWAALYTLCGDASVARSIKWWLMEHLLAEREAHQWAGRVERTSGERTKFSEELVDLFLFEELLPYALQAAPELRFVALQVEPHVWRRTLAHQYAAVAGEYHRALLDAEEHIRRKLRLTGS